MKFLVPLGLLLLLVSPAHAGTFELSDPANEMLAEQEAQAAERAAERVEEEQDGDARREQAGGGDFCTVDPETDRCVCIDRATVRVVPMTQEQCLDRIVGSEPSG